MDKNEIYSLDNEKIKQIAEHYKAILSILGEDPEREGLAKTPERAAKAMAYVTSGYRMDADEIVKSAIFTHEGSRMVIVRDIEFYSLCEHHILPFYGKVSVGYIPDGKIVGLSKVARAVEVFARRLQVQERMTRQICDVLTRELSAKGVIVMSEATHMCMCMRGIEKKMSTTEAVEYSGAFADASLRQEFYDMLRK